MGKLAALISAAAALVSVKSPTAVVTLPALQEWTPGTGTYTFSPDTDLVADDQLRPTAELFAAELRELTGAPLALRSGSARPGDIELKFGLVPNGPEAYQVTVGSSVVVQGNTDAGVFYGTRTVLQWLRQNRTFPAGTATDWPRYPERGLLVDTGRQYFSVPWLRDRIREMAYLKLNYLHLHLSDRNGFRLDSSAHPEIVSAQHYSVQEIRELVEYAARYHVQIVPEIDFPGHMDAILAAHQDLKLVNRSGVVNHGAIDLSKSESFALVKDLITEFMPLFPSRYWHLGADEYLTDYGAYPQVTKDTYLGFINWANGIVRSAGKTMRIYNDGLKPGSTVDATIVVEHWSGDGPGGLPWVRSAYSPKELVAAGHQVQNMAFTPTYYVTGGPAALFNTPPMAMYDLWSPERFVDGTTMSGHLGAKVSVWCDDPNAKSESQIAAALGDRLRVMAQQTWGSPKPLLYLGFIPVMKAVGIAPT